MSTEREKHIRSSIVRVAKKRDINYGRSAIDPLAKLLDSFRKRLVKIVKKAKDEDAAIKKSGVHYVFHPGILDFGIINYTGKDWGDQFINNTLQTVATIILSNAEQEAMFGVANSDDIKSTGLYKRLVKRAAKKPSKKPAKKPVKKPAKKSSKPARKAAKKSSKPAVKKAAKKSSKKAVRGYDALTVVELRAKAKERGLSGYSRLKKGELVVLLRGKTVKKAAKKPSRKAAKKSSKKPARKAAKKSSKKPARKAAAKKELTVVELRTLCKKKGVKGYSRLNKAALIKLCKK